MRDNKKKTAIIIPFKDLSWMTINCLKSIAASTDLDRVRVYLVDNNSEVSEAEKILEYLKESDVDYKHLVMDENYGFVIATNTGIKKAIEHGFEQFVMLNNDTIVTTGWLERMEYHLKDTVGFVNPMSTPVDWRETPMGKAFIEEQAEYEKIRPSMESFSRSISETMSQEKFDVDFVPFFCTLFSKNVVETVGLLSEDYDIGLFDDDDYCHRAREKGWKMAVARDAYVHHFHSSTFIQENIDYMNLLEQNRKVFEKKYQYDPWDRTKVKQ